MTRPSSVITRVYADTYATRAVLIELLEMMSRMNPGTLPAIRGAIAHKLVKPEDVSAVPDRDVREAIESILGAAAQ